MEVLSSRTLSRPRSFERTFRFYAERLGASGLTFFDDEVTEFFSPHAAGKSAMFLVALGHPDRAALGLAS